MKQPVFLELTEGCYGRKRSGEITGPLKQDPETGYITSDGEYGGCWYPTGAFKQKLNRIFDIIEILPPSETLPEPFEAWATITDKGEHFCTSHEDNAFNNNGPTDKVFRCKVTPIERVK